MLKKQARKARAEHQVKCWLETGKKKAKRKPLTELYVKEHFTGVREEWHKELQMHCEEVYIDQEETKEAQEGRNEYFKKRGRLFIEQCHVAVGLHFRGDANVYEIP